MKKELGLGVMLSLSVMLAPVSVQAKKSTKKAVTKMSASANAEKINVKITKPTSKGTLYAYRANEYAKNDKMRGISSNVLSKGIKLGSVSKGKTKTISYNRIGEDGSDQLYNKYYLLNGNKIVAGPVYATSVNAINGTVGYSQRSVKGLYCEDDVKNLDYASDVDANSITINIDLGSLMYSDASVAPADAISSTINGKTYYFNATNVSKYDQEVEQATADGMNVIGIAIAWKNDDYHTFPKALRYNSPNSKITMGTNTSNGDGRDDLIAMMEFLGNRYSGDEHGNIGTYVIGNELDFTHYWYSTGNLNKFMEEYSRALRLSNLAVKKYGSNIKVAAPFTHYWATSAGKLFKECPGPSLAPKKMIDWLAKYTNARGAYDWAIAPHPYGVVNTKSNMAESDSKRKGVLTGNYKTSKELTFSNLEILDAYLSQKSLKYKGKQRSVYLTESGASSGSMKTKNLNEQCASLAMAYYKVANLKFIKSFNYYRLQDNADETKNNLTCGLLKYDGTKKPAYDLYKAIDTKYSNSKSKKYLKYLKYYKDGKKKVSKVKSWKSAMSIYKTKFNWNKKWSWKNIYRK